MTTQVQYIGKYGLHKRLGRSSVAEVWKSYDSQRQSYVVMKFFRANLRTDPDFATRFRREAEVIAALRHPNIVQIREFRILSSQTPKDLLAYLVMDYVEDGHVGQMEQAGRTLADYIRSTPRAGTFPRGADIVQLFTPISLALNYVHQHGIIHGNLKPGNILLCRSNGSAGRIGNPLLTDFGLARLLGTSMTTLTHRSLEATLYISPEQARGDPGHERSDIYSLGVILYELCTGVLPFQGNRPVALMMQHISASPTPPSFVNPSISPALNNVILRCLTKDPAARFPSAVSMTAALARALNMPIPEELGSQAIQTDALSLNDVHVSSPAPATMPTSSGNRPGMSTPIGYSSLDPSSPASSAQNAQSLSGLASLPAMKRKRRESNLSFVLLSLLMIVLVGVVLSTLLLLVPNANTNLPQSPLIGHAFLTSSQQVNGSSDEGINDELQIDLQGLSDPDPGKSYYAWLLGDRNQSELPPIFLGKLQLNQSAVRFLYRGDQRHTNLLEFTSRFLITEEDADVTPSTPSPDLSTWKYYAEIPQTVIPGDKLHFSMLDHFRHLLVESPELKTRGLHGGLVIWLLQNTRKVLECANSAQDSWARKDIATIHSQLTCVLDYLDGISYVHTDVPSVTPLSVDKHNAQIALLGPVPKGSDPPGYMYDGEVPPGYVYLISLHLNGAVLAPQATPDQHKLAGQVNTALNKMKFLLDVVRQDAKLLIQMTNAQLLQSSSLSVLNDLVIQAQYAYAGQLNALTGASEGGALWIYGNCERLTSFDVTKFTAS